MNLKKISLILIALLVCAVAATASAATFESVLQRWTKERKYRNEFGSTLTIRATYYSSEFIEAYMQSEAEKNLWTQDETDNYMYSFLGALQLEEMIPVRFEFINYGPSMHMGPFDNMVTLRVGKKSYKPVDYDKRLNFKLQGKRDGLVYFPRYDEKTGKEILEGAKSVKVELRAVISPMIMDKGGTNPYFYWDVADDDPQKLFRGKTALRFESDRLLKRLDKLRSDKQGLEAQLESVNEEIEMIHERLDEIAKES